MYSEKRYKAFQKELETLININGIDNVCGTNDFILAQYIIDCIHSFKKAKEHDVEMRNCL